MVKTCPRTEMPPVREPPLLACTIKLTVPLPTPEAPPVMEIQPSAVVALQSQPASVVTLNDPLPPPVPYNQLLGLRAKVQLAWLMVKACPRTMMEPVRGLPLFVCTIKLTVPAPVPVAPPVMVIQPLVFEASQLQPAPVVTLNEPGPPAALYDQLLGLRAKAQ